MIMPMMIDADDAGDGRDKIGSGVQVYFVISSHVFFSLQLLRHRAKMCNCVDDRMVW